MMRPEHGFTLIELLIIMLVLLIVAMLVLPRIAITAEDARDAALSTDLKTLRRQLEVYKQQHGGKGPEVNEQGQFDLANLTNRMTDRTMPNGRLDSKGTLGPYLHEWPSNPFCDAAVAAKIKFGKALVPPRDGTTGWYFSIATRQIHVNSAKGAESVDGETDNKTPSASDISSQTATKSP